MYALQALVRATTISDVLSFTKYFSRSFEMMLDIETIIFVGNAKKGVEIFSAK